MRRSFFDHLHPAEVTVRALRPLTTLGLGIVAIALFGLLGLTGVLLMFYYVPTPEGALLSTRDIQHAVIFGGFVRALHRHAADAIVLVVFLHLLRVWLTGAYIGRSVNWTIGLVLFLLTLALAFTGYLLPADQLAYWAVTVSTNLLDHVPLFGTALKGALLGGDRVEGAALIRFYTLHVALLPASMLGLIALHLWRIRKEGGLNRGMGEGEPLCERVPSSPHLVLREAVLVLLVLAALCALSAFVLAPLGGPPDIHRPSNPEKTPWYFLFLQEMVSYSATMGGFLFPGLVLAILFASPFLDRNPAGAGRWLGTPRDRAAFAISLVFGFALMALLMLLFQHPSFTAWLAAGAPWLRYLLNPAALMLLAATVAATAARWRLSSTRAALLAGGAVILVAVVGLTIAGWSRGPGWILFWPWEALPRAY